MKFAIVTALPSHDIVYTGDVDVRAKMTLHSTYKSHREKINMSNGILKSQYHN